MIHVKHGWAALAFGKQWGHLFREGVEVRSEQVFSPQPAIGEIDGKVPGQSDKVEEVIDSIEGHKAL